MGACPIRTRVEGAPFQPGQRVKVVDAIDTEVDDVSCFVGFIGTVEYLEYSCGCAQTYPNDPMIGVALDDGRRYEFWPEELAPWEVFPGWWNPSSADPENPLFGPAIVRGPPGVGCRPLLNLRGSAQVLSRTWRMPLFVPWMSSPMRVRLVHATGHGEMGV